MSHTGIRSAADSTIRPYTHQISPLLHSMARWLAWVNNAFSIVSSIQVPIEEVVDSISGPGTGRSTTHHGLFSEVPNAQTTTGYQSFDHLRTTDELSERITQFTHSTGTIITPNDNRQLSTLWILLKDNRLISALIRQVRITFNYQCAHLIKIFVNISKIEWSQPTPPGGAIKQFGFVLHPGLASDNLRPKHPPNITRISRHFKFHTHSDKPRTRHLSGRHSLSYSLSPPLLHLLYDTPLFTYIPAIPLSLIIYDTLYPYHMIHSTWQATSITRHGAHLFHQTATEILV